MTSRLQDDPDTRIRTALNGLNVILCRTQLVERRWTDPKYPGADADRRDMALIASSCRAIATDVRQMQDNAQHSDDLLDRHDEHLAELQRMFDVNRLDMPAFRRELFEEV